MGIIPGDFPCFEACMPVSHMDFELVRKMFNS